MKKGRSRLHDTSDESLDLLQSVPQNALRRTSRAPRGQGPTAFKNGDHSPLMELKQMLPPPTTLAAAQQQVDAIGGSQILLKIGRAFFARMLFVVHSLTTVWQTVEVNDNPAYWGFALISIAILIEGSYTIIYKAGDERKWFCPSVMLYVLSTAPPIWLLEMDMSRRRYETQFGKGANASAINAMMRKEKMNTAGEPHLSMESTFRISHEMWVQLLEQFLLVILIVGRWMLPKGEITREQLSQILLAYLAIASDIVELFDVFKERPVIANRHLQYAVLGIWTMSLFQFPFVLTVSRARKMRVALTKSTSDEDLKRIHYRAMHRKAQRSTLSQILHDLDIWAIMLANSFQDIPFLVVRLYLMMGYHVMTYTMIFFTCKNALIIVLQTYRALVLINDRYTRPTAADDAASLAVHYTQMISQASDALEQLKRRHSALNLSPTAAEAETLARQELARRMLRTPQAGGDGTQHRPKQIKKRKSKSPKADSGRPPAAPIDDACKSPRSKPGKRRRRPTVEDLDNVESGSGSGTAIPPPDTQMTTSIHTPHGAGGGKKSPRDRRHLREPHKKISNQLEDLTQAAMLERKRRENMNNLDEVRRKISANLEQMDKWERFEKSPARHRRPSSHNRTEEEKIIKHPQRLEDERPPQKYAHRDSDLLRQAQQQRRVSSGSEDSRGDRGRHKQPKRGVLESPVDYMIREEKEEGNH